MKNILDGLITLKGKVRNLLTSEISNSFNKTENHFHVTFIQNNKPKASEKLKKQKINSNHLLNK